MKKKLIPLQDRVIIKRTSQTQTPSGIVIPETAAEKADQGIVIAIGSGKRDEKGALIPLAVKVDDIVLFGKYAGQTVKFEDEELLIMREEDILAVVHDE